LVLKGEDRKTQALQRNARAREGQMSPSQLGKRVRVLAPKEEEEMVGRVKKRNDGGGNRGGFIP